MRTYIIILSFITISIFSCKKSEFLNEKPDQSLVVPKKISDFQAILDNAPIMNGVGAGGQGLIPQMGEAASDNYFLLDANYNSNIKTLYQNYYIWAQQVYTGDVVFDWNVPYRAVFYSNVVLDGLSGLNSSEVDQSTYNNIKGCALFYRAHLFYHLAQIFAPQYNSSTAESDWGIPLRLKADVGEKIERATMAQTYSRIKTDLEEAKSLLPLTQLVNTRPTKIAVYALLARLYQTMKEYDKAYSYADSALQLKSDLLDYNSIPAASQTGTGYTFAYLGNSINHPEVIFSSNMLGLSIDLAIPVRPAYAKIDSNLYNSYNTNDLRKIVFFRTATPSGYRFKGSYDGQENSFAGLAVDEMYLIRAEMNARKGDKNAALNDLNSLLAKRWKTGFFVPLTANSASEALGLILTERRKELCFRATRWPDLRRLNSDGENISLTRKVNGQTYVLVPGDIRFVYPIPPQVINFNPEMPQNPR